MSSSRGPIKRVKYLGVDCLHGQGMKCMNWSEFVNYCTVSTCQKKLVHITNDYFQRCVHPKCMIKIVSKEHDLLLKKCIRAGYFPVEMLFRKSIFF